MKLVARDAQFALQDEGTLWLVLPLTPVATDWLESNVEDSAMWMGGALVVEHRYVRDLVDGMVEAGLGEGRAS